MEKIKDYLFLHLSVMMFSFTSVFSKLASREFNHFLYVLYMPFAGRRSSRNLI